MANLSRAAADTILRTLFSGTLYLGLARGTVEETDAGYRRMPVQLGDPQGDGARYVTNAEPVIFPAYGADATGEIDTAFITSATGALIWSEQLDRPRNPRAGDMPLFPAGSFVIRAEGGD